MVVFLKASYLPMSVLLLWILVFYTCGLPTNADVASTVFTSPSTIVDDPLFTTTSRLSIGITTATTTVTPTPAPSASPISSGTVVHHDDHLSGVTHAPTSSSSSTTTTTDHHTDDGFHHGTDDTHGGVTTHHAEDDTHHGVLAHHSDDNHGAHASAHGEVHHSSVFGIITGEPLLLYCYHNNSSHKY